MKPTAVINLIGLTERYVNSGAMPRLKAFAERGKMVPLETVIPSVTCPVEASLLTGTYPSEHGIVANGWYFRDMGQVRFWEQSNHMVQRPEVWATAKTLNPEFTCAKLFWWYNMYSSVDFAITPAPIYACDGRVIPEIYTNPLSLRDKTVAARGQFPVFDWWGPSVSIRSSRWIADTGMWLYDQEKPTLSLMFLPHIDFAPHVHGPDAISKIAKGLGEIDEVCGDLIDFFDHRDVRVMFLAEYEIRSVSRPIMLNRRFRERGWIAFREEQGTEVVYPGSCDVFAVTDQQVAHIYVNKPSLYEEVRDIVAAEPGVAEVLEEEGKRAYHIDHPRSGEMVALAEPDSWFAYYYWLDDRKAPGYARTVDILRKPGYDPLELFIDKNIRFPGAKYVWSLLKDKVGFRMLFDFIPLDASLCVASHGSNTDGPVLLTQHPELLPDERLHATQVHDVILDHLGLLRR